jgi:hypothetical protein
MIFGTGFSYIRSAKTLDVRTNTHTMKFTAINSKKVKPYVSENYPDYKITNWSIKYSVDNCYVGIITFTFTNDKTIDIVFEFLSLIRFYNNPITHEIQDVTRYGSIAYIGCSRERWVHIWTTKYEINIKIDNSSESVNENTYQELFAQFDNIACIENIYVNNGNQLVLFQSPTQEVVITCDHPITLEINGETDPDTNSSIVTCVETFM